MILPRGQLWVHFSTIFDCVTDLSPCVYCIRDLFSALPTTMAKQWHSCETKFAKSPAYCCGPSTEKFQPSRISAMPCGTLQPYPNKWNWSLMIDYLSSLPCWDSVLLIRTVRPSERADSSTVVRITHSTGLQLTTNWVFDWLASYYIQANGIVRTILIRFVNALHAIMMHIQSKHTKIR